MTAFARTRNQFGTWLALLAMCLVVFAPAISQLNVSEHPAVPDAAICSASAMGPDSHNPHSGTTLSACGYCDILATAAAPPPVILATSGWLPLFITIVRAPPARMDASVLSYLSGDPRAPPSVT